MFKKIVGRTIAIVITIVVAATLIFACLFSAGLLPYQAYAITTGSMDPSIPTTSAVLVVKTHEIQPGEAIAFHHYDDIIVHRWIGTNPDGTLLTKGDANETADPWSVDRADVIGGVVRSVPHLGVWLMFFGSPFGIAFVVLIFLDVWLFRLLFSELASEKDDTESVSEEESTPIQVA